MNQLLDKNTYTKDTEPSPFSELNGPFYTKVVGERIYKAFEVLPKNCNKANIAHGGILVAFSDGVMGYTAWQQNQLPCLTAKINGNYIAPAKLGSWVYGYADIVKTTNEITFTTCNLFIDEKVILTADGIFKILVKKNGESSASTYPAYAD
jgi:acyl-coenzyme A thioesterase PaaI-like protein